MIAIIDYGAGNIHSIENALEEVGGDVCVTDDHEKIKTSERIVFPGVGAFGSGIKNLAERGLDSVLREEVIDKKKPFLGICLGMQLLMAKSHEFGEHAGLGWFRGDVLRLEPEGGLRVPHVGWNSVSFKKEHHLLDGVKDGSDFYFVHSFSVVPAGEDVVVGTCDYGSSFVAAIARENIFATQFHPEKSQKEGLKILSNFLNWSPC